MFKHFVITQFNLRKFPYQSKDKTDWENWTQNRINLFYTYCLPSFLNQSNKNFTWLIYFDTKTPEKFNDLLKRLNEINFIKLCFADSFDHFMTKYTKDIRELSTDNKWVITSRCDNDDVLQKDAVDTIQRNFVPKNEFLISLASGYTLNIADNTLAHYYYPMSPFISLIESTKKTSLNGVFYKEHTKWDELRLKITTELLKKNNKSIFILEKPCWIQIIHNQNVSNNFKRGLPVIRSKDLRHDFGINIQTKRQSVFSIPEYYDYVLWKRYFKSRMVRLFLKRKHRMNTNH
jgi:hypothetical protein